MSDKNNLFLLGLVFICIVGMCLEAKAEVIDARFCQFQPKVGEDLAIEIDTVGKDAIVTVTLTTFVDINKDGRYKGKTEVCRHPEVKIRDNDSNDKDRASHKIRIGIFKVPEKQPPSEYKVIVSDRKGRVSRLLHIDSLTKGSREGNLAESVWKGFKPFLDIPYEIAEKLLKFSDIIRGIPTKAPKTSIPLEKGELCLIDIKNHKVTTCLPKSGSYTMPSLSPDSKSIVFVLEADGNRDIWRVNINGRKLQQLTRTEADEFNPVWSPDGKGIAFIRDSSIWFMDTDGGDCRELVKEIRVKRILGWLSEIKGLVFISSAPEANNISELWVAEIDSRFKKVTLSRLVYDPVWLLLPQLSPGKKRLVFVREEIREGRRDWNIYLKEIDKEKESCLTTDKGRNLHPAWSSDGKRVVFVSYRYKLK